MGDWIARWHWVTCPGEVSALAVYDRLEQEAAELRRSTRSSGSLRFGFASPRLIAALAVAKWGEDRGLLGRITVDLPGVTGVVCDQGEYLCGDLESLGAAHAFAWAPKPEGDALLASFEIARVGAVAVRVLDPATAASVFVARDRPTELSGPEGPVHVIETPPRFEGEHEIVVGVVSPTHGLIQLGQIGRYTGWSAEAMRLYASRIGGPGNWNVVRDDVEELPDTYLFDDVAWRLERHGPHVVWQSRGQRRRWVRDARLAKAGARRLTEQRSGAAMARRWGFDMPPEPLRPNDDDWRANLPASPAIDRFVAAVDGEPVEGARFAELVRRVEEAIARRDPRVPEFAARFAELAHAVSRTSYWMVRDGGPLDDTPPDRVGPRPPWDGDPKSIATAIEFWAWAANCARRIADPARAALATFVALDAALATASPVWWTPPHAWIEALLHAEIAGDSDAEVDPTIHEASELDEPAARAALEIFLDGEARIESAPRDSIPLFEAAERAAKAAGAPVLALRARLRLLAALLEIDDRERFTIVGTELLRDLPSPISIVHYSTAGELAERALRWTANALAWHAYERGEHERALELVDRALVVCDQRFDDTRDTKVRALLGLGRTDEAYRIVREVLARKPDFETFADLATSAGYLTWLDAT